ncbi:MAG: alpha/beta fold hydrolase, partial [Acidimicrobiia bacterium]
MPPEGSEASADLPDDGSGAPRRGRPRLRLVRDPAETPVIGPGVDRSDQPLVALPRLARHELTLPDGHAVGVAVCGTGTPLVVVHGFFAEGILYAQSLSRLVALGFKVIAIDTAGHGGTLGLPTGAQSLESYSRLLGRVLDHLGVRRAVLLGHSMGGRLVTDLAAREPERAIAVILVDAIVGDVWDHLVDVARVFPPVLAGVAAGLALDTLATVPLVRDPRQAAKLLRLVVPTLVGHARRPWRMVGPSISILRSRGSGTQLDRLGEARIPVFAIHGDRDLAVPLATSISAARRSRGQAIVVEKASHSWLL